MTAYLSSGGTSFDLSFTHAAMYEEVMRTSRILLSAAGIAALTLALPALAARPAARDTVPCHAAVRSGILPVWARAGFSGPKPRIPHVLGRSGRIAAILFGYPLLSPPAETRNNKILWVSRAPAKTSTALWIRAQRMEGGRGVGPPEGRIVRGAPGPSIIDLPEAGCWRFTLHWAGRADTLDLEYAPR